MVDFTEIIKQKVSEINLTLDVLSTEAGAQGVKVYVCKTLFLRPGKCVTDEGGNTFEVVDFEDNNWVELIPKSPNIDPFDGVQVICPPVYYLHGTPSSVNGEYRQIAADSASKLPLIWLNENFTENFSGPGSSVERQVEPDLFFMDDTDQAWTNEQHHRLCTKPMCNLADEFFLTFKSDRLFKRLLPVVKIPRVRFGVYRNEHGNEDRIINDHLSAVQTHPTLIKYKEGCKC